MVLCTSPRKKRKKKAKCLKVSFWDVDSCWRSLSRFIYLIEIIKCRYSKFIITSFFFFFFSSFLATSRHMEFRGQGSDPSCSCGLSYSWVNTGSFNPLCGTGDWTWVPVLLRRLQSHCTTAETPFFLFFISYTNSRKIHHLSNIH